MGNKANRIAEFDGKIDRFNGIQVDCASERRSSKGEFAARLQMSLRKWKCEKRRGIWFRIDSNHSGCIPTLIANEFRFHHARENYVMMYRWLPEDEPCLIPRYPHNYIGVGAFVVNGNGEVLVVKERYASASSSSGPPWKLPGGYVEFGEQLAEAAEREVLEETGVSARFVSVVGFRHVHNVQFDCSDIYFVCHLAATTTTIRKCNRELLDCTWMKLESYRDDPGVNEVNRYFARTFMRHFRKEEEAGGAEVFSPLDVECMGRKHLVYTLNPA